jgi:hypothetical protein
MLRIDWCPLHHGIHLRLSSQWYGWTVVAHADIDSAGRLKLKHERYRGSPGFDPDHFELFTDPDTGDRPSPGKLIEALRGFLVPADLRP